MKKTIAALIFISVISAPALAFADTIQNGYGNTFVVSNAQGQSLRYYFNQDGTFSVTTPDNQSQSGTYTVADGQLCLTPSGGQQGCVPLMADKNVGDTWEQTGTDGSTISVTLQAGR